MLRTAKHNIRVSEQVLKRLRDLKQHPRETDDDVLYRELKCEG